MHRSRSKAHARVVVLATLATLVSTFAWTPASARHEDPPPIGQYCYLEADKGNFPDDNDLITRIDTGAPDTPGPNEFAKGFTGTTGIEALAMRQSDEQLYAADHDILGRVDEHTGVFTPVSGAPWGPGNGAEGVQSLDDADGLSFHPDGRLYASIRREDTDAERDLLIRVDPETGELVRNNFGPGVDYVVVFDPARNDVDDITFDSAGVLWGVTNNDGVGSHLVKIDLQTGATADHKPIDSDPGNPAINAADDIESLGWGNEGGRPTLFGLNGKAVPGAPDNISRLWEINPETGQATFRSRVGENATVTGARDYEGIACALGPSGGYDVEVTPDRALNSTETTHTFTVTVIKDGQPVQNDHPTIQVQNGTVVEDNCSTQGTDANGQCTVVVGPPTDGNGDPQAGTTTLTATSGDTNGTRGVDWDTDTAVKVFVDICKCIDFFDPGEDMPLLITFTVPTGDNDPDTAGDQEGLDNAVLTDDLPPEYIFQSATAIDGVTPTTPTPGSSNGEVRWEFAHLAPGRYQGTIFVQLVPGLPDGHEVTNVVELTAEGFEGSATTTHTAVVINEADARAYGVSVDLLGNSVIAPTPDSDVQNPDELIAVPNPLPGASDPLVRVLAVEEGDASDANHAESFAEAKAVEADINIPGAVRVQADAVVARASSTASATSASSTAAGSTIGNLRINGTQYGDISEPTTIVINDPLNPGTPFVEVHVLERQLSGSAAGVQQPEPFGNGRVFRSGIIVKGIHVVVHDLAATPIDETSDITVSHAQAFATFGPAVDCRTGPRLSGDAYMVQLFNVEPDLAHAIVGHVKLPVTGGHEEEHLADIDLPAPLGTIDVATTRVGGSRTIGATPAEDTGNAFALAQVAETHLLADNVNARAVEARADCDQNGCDGGTTIANLVIAGTDVCATLMLGAVCEPAPNTEISLPAAGVIVRLNEQIPDAEPHGLTVNAVHIFVVGEGNPLGLPVGAEIIISSAHADVRPSVNVEGC